MAAGDLLVVSTDKGELSALRADDFSAVWTFPTGQEDPKLDLEAIYGTPLIVEDTVYFGSYSKAVYALSLEDGSLRWSRKVDGPLIAGLAVLHPAADATGSSPGGAETIFVATDAGTVYALDPEDGGEKWRFHAGDGIWGAPLVTGKYLYAASVNGKLFALDPEDGSEVWRFETEHGLISDPVLGGKDTVLVGGIDRRLHAVDADTGRERWSFKAGNWFWARPLVHPDRQPDGVVYAPNLDGKLYALNLSDGSEFWDAPFEAEEALRSSPLLADDGATMVVADRDGNLYGLDPSDGALKWAGPAALQETVLSDPIAVPPLLGEEVFVSAEGGALFRLDPAGGSFVKVVTP